jgi:hypothetical protein
MPAKMWAMGVRDGKLSGHGSEEYDFLAHERTRHYLADRQLIAKA